MSVMPPANFLDSIRELIRSRPTVFDDYLSTDSPYRMTRPINTSPSIDFSKYFQAPNLSPVQMQPIMDSISKWVRPYVTASPMLPAPSPMIPGHGNGTVVPTPSGILPGLPFTPGSVGQTIQYPNGSTTTYDIMPATPETAGHTWGVHAGPKATNAGNILNADESTGLGDWARYLQKTATAAAHESNANQYHGVAPKPVQTTPPVQNKPPVTNPPVNNLPVKQPAQSRQPKWNIVPVDPSNPNVVRFESTGSGARPKTNIPTPVQGNGTKYASSAVPGYVVARSPEGHMKAYPANAVPQGWGVMAPNATVNFPQWYQQQMDYWVGRR